MSWPADQPIEVLVVDDEERFRRVLTAILAVEADIAVVGEAADGAEAVAKATSLMPDVVLLDVRMPGTGGIEAAQAIKAWSPTTKVVMLTASDEDEDLYKALRAGASGYLLKEKALVDVCLCVRAAASGQAVLSPSMAARLVADFVGPTRDTTSQLSSRELDILRLVADGQSNRQIADDLALSPHTVKRHIANILARLHQHSRVEAVLAAQRSGLLG
ncbi:MAG TPA: response regulator transcription factor [Acidimicrobiales bacterium]|jgi:two-component system NarL family response regulator|nr:response regulator transcription factor [Acidimicrobiales bacterium]